METRLALFSSWTSFYNSSLDCARNDVQEIRQTRPTHRKLKKKQKSPTQTTNKDEGWEERTRSPPARAGFWKDDQGHRGTGAGSASRHGGGLGRVHPHDRVPGIPLSYRTGCTRRHGGRRGRQCREGSGLKFFLFVAVTFGRPSAFHAMSERSALSSRRQNSSQSRRLNSRETSLRGRKASAKGSASRRASGAAGRAQVRRME